MVLRPLITAALAALLALALLAALAATNAAPVAQAKARWCGTWTLASAPVKVRIRVLRGTTCKRAKVVARRYDAFKDTPPWNCALAHDNAMYKGHLVLYSCGAGSPTSGDLRTRKHAFLVVKA
ncbi:MAG: hypothetical protein QOG15_1821 [Solirubrobacteraceae bacterium]|jgi:hypothetical protein|nr:hypothetical protein [Solirubrobacteraceae bacterium]